jgi:hypothetical protein
LARDDAGVGARTGCRRGIPRPDTRSRCLVRRPVGEACPIAHLILLHSRREPDQTIVTALGLYHFEFTLRPWTPFDVEAANSPAWLDFICSLSQALGIHIVSILSYSILPRNNADGLLSMGKQEEMDIIHPIGEPLGAYLGNWQTWVQEIRHELDLGKRDKLRLERLCEVELANLHSLMGNHRSW